MHEGAKHRLGDGSDWTVCEDWEAEGGLTNNIFLLLDASSALQTRFTHEPIFLEVIDTLLSVDLLSDEHTRHHAQHHSIEYFIEADRLWYL